MPGIGEDLTKKRYAIEKLNAFRKLSKGETLNWGPEWKQFEPKLNKRCFLSAVFSVTPMATSNAHTCALGSHANYNAVLPFEIRVQFHKTWPFTRNTLLGPQSSENALKT